MERLLYVMALSCVLHGAWAWFDAYSQFKRQGQLPAKKTNFIIMLMDDVGWGDVGAYGSTAKETPNIDKMANQGMLFTNFYAPSPMCSPSRASMLTGRMPIRNGFYTDVSSGKVAVSLPNVTGGIEDSELLVSELLQADGYKTKYVGKWHLGHEPHHNPIYHGFDEYYGSLTNRYSYDPKTPMFKDDTMIGRFFQGEFQHLANGESNVSMKYLDESIDFIKTNAKSGDPFFLVWAPDSTHTDNYASAPFLGTSERGLFGDAMREMDFGVGKILKTLRRLKIHQDTLVFFSSDNGAAIYAERYGGDNGPFLCGKLTTYEGGQRVPGIAWWPQHIQRKQVSRQISTLMDFFHTILDVAGIQKPADREYDGTSLVDTLLHGQEQDQNLFYYRGDTLYAVRSGEYKAHRWVANPEFYYNFCPGDYVEGVTTGIIDYTAEPILFNLCRDPGEKYMISPETDEYKAIMPYLIDLMEEYMNNTEPGAAQFNYVDEAVKPWAPKGCEALNDCFPVPTSEPILALWPF